MRPAQNSTINIDVDLDDEREEVTGVYDASFFRAKPQQKDAHQSLEDASIGLKLFMDEAEQALAQGGLTVDQRIHVSTILSYIEGLSKRFDLIRRPGFVQRKA